MRQFRLLFQSFAVVIILAFVAIPSTAQTQLSAELIEKIDKVATDTLARTGVPSASVAVVKDGKVAYVKAYGDARLDPKTPAAPSMRYSIGSFPTSLAATR
jgi:CubicO group peptidase (beta-lactamase class C family)